MLPLVGFVATQLTEEGLLFGVGHLMPLQSTRAVCDKAALVTEHFQLSSLAMELHVLMNYTPVSVCEIAVGTEEAFVDKLTLISIMHQGSIAVFLVYMACKLFLCLAGVLAFSADDCAILKQCGQMSYSTERKGERYFKIHI